MPELLDRNLIFLSDQNHVSKNSSRYEFIVGQVYTNAFKSLCGFVVSAVWWWMLGAHSMSYGYYSTPGKKAGIFDLHGTWQVMPLLRNNTVRLEISSSVLPLSYLRKGKDKSLPFLLVTPFLFAFLTYNFCNTPTEFNRIIDE